MTEHWGAVAIELLRLLVEDDAAAHASPSLRSRAAAALPELERRNISTLYYIAFEPQHAVQRLCDRVWEVQQPMIRDAVATLTARGIPALVFKGVEFLARHFGSHRVVDLGDVDILVPRETLGDALVALQGLGYDNRYFDYAANRWEDDDPIKVAHWHATHDHEMWPVNFARPMSLTRDEIELRQRLKLRGVAFPDGSPACKVKIDLHFNVGPEFRLEDALQRAVPGAIGAGLAFGPSDHLWLAIVRYYKSVACYEVDSLHHIAYVTRHLARSVIDWDIVLREVLETNAHIQHGAPAMFYILGLLARIDERLVPREVIERFRPSGARRDDWGWQIGKLFGFTEPCPLPIVNGRLEGRPPWMPERS